VEAVSTVELLAELKSRGKTDLIHTKITIATSSIHTKDLDE
jgi:hypothetical protein